MCSMQTPLLSDLLVASFINVSVCSFRTKGCLRLTWETQLEVSACLHEGAHTGDHSCKMTTKFAICLESHSVQVLQLTVQNLFIFILDLWDPSLTLHGHHICVWTPVDCSAGAADLYLLRLLWIIEKQAEGGRESGFTPSRVPLLLLPLILSSHLRISN